MKDLCRDRGVSQETFYRWRRKLGGMEVSGARRLSSSRTRTGGSRSWLTLDKEALKDVPGRKWWSPRRGGRGCARFAYSERRACGLIRMDRSSFRYRPRSRGDGEVRKRLVELAVERPRFGYRRLRLASQSGHRGEPQEDSTVVSGGVPFDPGQEAQAGGPGSAGAEAPSEPGQRALVHGFHAGHAGHGALFPDVQRRG